MAQTALLLAPLTLESLSPTPFKKMPCNPAPSWTGGLFKKSFLLQSGGFVKSSPTKAGLGAQKLRSEAYYRYAATTKLKRNAADGLFTKPSLETG